MTPIQLAQAIQTHLRATPGLGVSAQNIVLGVDWESFAGEPERFPAIAIAPAGGKITVHHSGDEAKVVQRVAVRLVHADTEAAHLSSPVQSLGEALMGWSLDPAKPRSNRLQLTGDIDVQPIGGYVETTLQFEHLAIWRSTHQGA